MFPDLRARWSLLQLVGSAIAAKSGLKEYIRRNTCILIKVYFQSQAAGPWVVVFLPRHQILSFISSLDGVH